MGDAHVPAQRIGLRESRELRHASGAPQTPQRAVDDGHTRRIVAAVFQTAQAFEEDRNDVTVGYGGHDAAHDTLR
jgi:hypothetical protein